MTDTAAVKSNNSSNTIHSLLEMAYGRHTFSHRGGQGGGATSGNSKIIAPSRSLADYRNKIAAILGVTVLYTAFLYNSGSSIIIGNS